MEPLPFCPHLSEIQPLPGSGLSSRAPCQQCGAEGENWICLTCYEVMTDDDDDDDDQGFLLARRVA